MQEFSPENFWWNNITGPSEMINSAENALSEGYSIILGVPAFTPWPGKMRNILHENLSGGDIYITIIDADSETSDEVLYIKHIRELVNFLKQNYSGAVCACDFEELL